QAQSDGIEAIARKVIKFISTEERIEITSPKEIVINAQGSQLKINSGGVFTTTGAKFEAKAGQHVFSGGQKVEIPSRKFNTSPCYLMYQITDSTGEPLKNTNYMMYLADGTVEKGKTN